ncbi:hypothetical protein [Kocuria tytonis]|uniref:Uncharacterized protein n=1 Tax=Kocuria tytonis TaxID=2054280 RepID=A0A495A4E1_9MICC|nr:hypothetical protein [Kocuria tytonis]RKQ34059.1 hypothetical protein C1C97_009400 [Kocuria tytonis]
MSEYPRDEFDDVPEDGARQGAHRGHNPRARTGSPGEFRAVLVSGVLALALGAVCFVNAPRTAQDAQASGPVAGFQAQADDAVASPAARVPGGVVPARCAPRSAGDET